MIDVHHAVGVHNNNVGSTFNLLFAIRDLLPRRTFSSWGRWVSTEPRTLQFLRASSRSTTAGRKDRSLSHVQADSFYHWSKVSGSNHIMFASKIWGVRSTDVMQGVVFGTRIDNMGDDERLLTTPWTSISASALR